MYNSAAVSACPDLTSSHSCVLSGHHSNWTLRQIDWAHFCNCHTTPSGGSRLFVRHLGVVFSVYVFNARYS